MSKPQFVLEEALESYERMSFRESLTRHFKAVKDTTCNCLFCRNLNKKVNHENND